MGRTWKVVHCLSAVSSHQGDKEIAELHYVLVSG